MSSGHIVKWYNFGLLNRYSWFDSKCVHVTVGKQVSPLGSKPGVVGASPTSDRERYSAPLFFQINKNVRYNDKHIFVGA